MPEILVSKQTPLVDECFEISIQGLTKKQHVTIKATTKAGTGLLSSFGCYIADDNGHVSLYSQPSLSGTYTGIEPMGLFWSMKQDPGQERGQRYMKRKAISPQVVTISLFGGHLSWEEIHSNLPTIATKTIQRYFKSENVKRKEIKHGRIRGTLFIPPGNGPFPGIIDMFGWMVGTVEFRAAMFANRGFISFALAYLVLDGLPDTIKDLEISYFKEAVIWFQSHPLVMQSGIGVCGRSKGGEIGLVMSTVCPQIRAAVNINGAPFPTGFSLVPGKKYVKYDETKNAKGDQSIFISRDAFAVDSTKDILIETWKTDVKVLYLVGEDDQSINPRFAKMLQDAYPEEKRHNITVVKYPGTGHLIEPPYLPHCEESYTKTSQLKYGKAYDKKDFIFIWGGETDQHAKAQEDAWNRTLAFFRSNLTRSLASESRL